MAEAGVTAVGTIDLDITMRHVRNRTAKSWEGGWVTERQERSLLSERNGNPESRQELEEGRRVAAADNRIKWCAKARTTPQYRMLCGPLLYWLLHESKPHSPLKVPCEKLALLRNAARVRCTIRAHDGTVYSSVDRAFVQCILS